MSQIVYTAPLSLTTRLLIVVASCLAGAISWFAVGFDSAITKTLGMIFFTLQIVNALVDPDVCYIWFTRTNADGTKVKVIRPLVGFRKFETQIGFTGGYEVRYDGWRYEPAVFRI
jgi:hypothetical protein